MSYFIDESAFTCDMITERILNTDLIPSLEILKERIPEVMETFKAAGVGNLSDLRKMLKSKAKLPQTAQKLKMEEDDLILLRREVEGWIAKVRKLDEFDWIDPRLRQKLAAGGITDSEKAFGRLSAEGQIQKTGKDLDVPEAVLQEIYGISDLLRIRWLSPGFARGFYDLGYTADRIRQADPGKLTEEIDRHNKEKNYYNGKVGERDIRRIIFESRFV